MDILEKKATELRRDWGIDIYSPINIFNTFLEKKPNSTLLWLPLKTDISGACAKTDDDLLIVINSSNSKGRQNFTLAHELYHALYEDSDEWFICNTKVMNDAEKNAELFASLLLLPNAALYEFINKHDIEAWSLDDIIKCEQYFNISHKAMLVRLKQEKLISPNEFNKFKDNIIHEASIRGFETDLYKSSPKNKEYYALGSGVSLIEKVFKKNKISKGKKDELLMDIFRSDLVFQ